MAAIRGALTFQSVKYAIKIAIGGSPRLFFVFHRLFGDRSDRHVGRDTEIVIEGFPRCANSFARAAFEEAQQRPVRIAHHMHSPAQILRGASYGIPCLALIRKPEDAIRSLMLYHPRIDPRLMIRDYVSFYSSILPIKKQIVIGEFDIVTAQFDKVIDTINRKYGTNFLKHHFSEEDREAIFVRNVSRRTQAGLPADPDRHAMPSKEKNEKKDALNLRPYRTQLEAAHDVYLAFVDAGQDRG